MVLILVAAVSLTLPSPPRALIAQAGAAGGASGVVTVTGEMRGYVVNMEVSPAKPGENMVMFHLHRFGRESRGDAAGR